MPKSGECLLMPAFLDVMPRFSLSPAEMAVNALLLEGLSIKAIASELMMSVRTVESRVSHSLANRMPQPIELVIWLMTNTPMQS